MSRHSFRKYLNRTSQKVLVVDPQGLDEAKESELAAERFRTYFKMRQILYGKTDWVDVAWTHGVLKHTIQKDSCSCGVYVMQMAKEVVESFPETPSKIRIPSSQHILSELRKEMAVTILEASVFNPKDHCSFCGQESPAGRVGLNTWIQCSSCARWYHAVCVNITKKGVRKLKRALWLCAFCKPTTMCETMGKADIWLIRTYWDFEYPRPLLPNFKFVGGLHCKPAKPLSKDLEKFVQSSGDHGIVVFSLGSMINNLTMERANTIASALGQIPQKVVWRYSGKTPETLAPNTKLYEWIPQNDLLGHPKTKAFITHGGTNGLYEAIYHGVPMVGFPLFADQPDNMMHMKTKGAAVVLDINTMESNDLVDALKTVLNNPSYKESIMRLSRIHHDQPMKPLDQAVFWIEFVMRNKGAKHLRVQAHDLSWYQYHCLDVVAFLLSVVALITFLFIKTCSFFFRKCFRKMHPDGKAQKNKKE
ncbi:UDP-glucuronosyltransferase 2A1-like isoform X6 [Chanodichthys erythropterus]|uniref:UDP-glucuronosyltransferase 2A1-like isoform X6 n=2 Tax=Chanodichthys erythropterus TaxID=933992 RepID=UPI00351E8100